VPIIVIACTDFVPSLWREKCAKARWRGAEWYTSLFWLVGTSMTPGFNFSRKKESL
jgi:hypothetical protein